MASALSLFAAARRWVGSDAGCAPAGRVRAARRPRSPLPTPCLCVCVCVMLDGSAAVFGIADVFDAFCWVCDGSVSSDAM